MELTEQELIKQLLLQDLDIQQQLNSKHYQKVGFIASGTSLKAFIKTAEQLFQSVEVSGRGSKRIYTVGEPYTKIQSREDKRINNGQKDILPQEEELMQAILQNLNYYKLQGKDYSLSLWARELQFPREQAFPLTRKYYEYEFKLNDFYHLKYIDVPFYKPREIINEYVIYYNRMQLKLIERMFYWLQKYGHIKYSERFKASKSKETITITNEQYLEYHELLKKLIQEKGYHYFQFKSLEALISRWDIKVPEKDDVSMPEYLREAKENFEEIYDEIYEKLGFDFAFKTFYIEEVKTNDVALLPCSANTLSELYKEYLLNSAKRYRYKTKTNDKTIWHHSSFFYKAFFYLSLSIILDKPSEEDILNFEHDLTMYMRRYYIARYVPFYNKPIEDMIQTKKIINATERDSLEILRLRNLSKISEKIKREEELGIIDLLLE